MRSDEENKGDRSPRSNKAIVIAVIAVILAFALGVYFLAGKEKKPVLVNTFAKDSLNSQKDSSVAVKDSLKTSDIYDYTDEEGEYVNEYFFAQDAATDSRSFRFGQKVYKDYYKSNENVSVFYLIKPEKGKPLPTAAYQIESDYLVSEEEMSDFQKNFSLPPFNTIDLKAKRLVLDKDYSDGTEYSITQNAERAKSTICSGDFDDDGVTDLAVILDNNESQKSRLLVICTNTVTKAKYLAYAENYSDKVKINAYRKGASILMNEDSENGRVGAPADGIILKSEDAKLAIMYDKKLQKFKTWYQE